MNLYNSRRPCCRLVTKFGRGVSEALFLLGLVGRADAEQVYSPSGISKPWLPAAESAQSRLLGEAGEGEGEGFLERFSFTLGTAFVYDSNLTQGNGLNRQAEGDWFISVLSGVTWNVAIDDFTLGLQASANYDQFASIDDYSGMDYSGSLTLGYRGGPLSLGAALSYHSTLGVDRFASGLIRNSSVGLGFTADYTLSEKTSLSAGLTARDSTFDVQTGTATGGESPEIAFSLAAMWQASPLLQVGPGFTSSFMSSTAGGDRSTIGYMLRANYILSEKLTFNGRVGLESAEFDGGASNEFLTAGLGAVYRLDAIWSFTLDLTRDVLPDASVGGGFRESTRWRLGVSRPILASQFDIGLSHETSAFATSIGRSGSADVGYLAIDGGLGIPLFDGRSQARLFLRHQENSSADPTWDWSGIQSGISFSHRF